MTEKVCVFSAKPLTEKDRLRIEKIFGKKHSNAVEYEYRIDTALLGGLLVIDGNDYYDSTVSSRLAKMKRNLS